MGTTEFGIGNSPIFLCSDGCQYVVKCNYPPQHNRVILNEFISFHLARLLGVPMPEGELVIVPGAVIPNGSHVQAGVQFGLRREDSVRNLEGGPNRQPIIKIAFSVLFAACDNKEDFGGVLAFDQLIANGDRANNAGNWLFVIREERQYLYVIDHGHALGGPAQPKQFPTSSWVLPRGPYYTDLVAAIPPDQRGNPFNSVVAKATTLSETQIDNIFEGIPKEWDIPKDELKALKACIMERASGLRVNLTQLIQVERRYPDIGNGGHLSWDD